MNNIFSEKAWEDYIDWQMENKTIVIMRIRLQTYKK